MATYKSDGLRITTYANGTSGTAGKGISNIENYYYAATTENILEIPAVGNAAWKTAISQLTDKPFNETNKYLWNYELITYTDNTSSDTGRVMIAVYSSDGKDGRGISDILEFYILTEDNNAPSNLPTDTNDNGWVKSPIPVPSSAQPYLWNYEIVDYTDGTDTTFGPTCIGTYGNSIVEVKEYYLATATNTAPTSYTDSGWKETVSEAGQGATKPYLWNYEETVFSINETKKTPITLLSASPRAIKKVTEYYQQLPSDAAAPSGVTWKADDDKHLQQPQIPTGWSTARAALEPGKIMWNMEIIEYAAVDNEGKNLYEATSPAQAGYAGTNGKDAVAALAISLSNDKDLIPASSEGEVDENTALGGATTKITLYKNGEEDASTNPKLDCVVTANGKVVDKSNYTFANKNFKLNKWGSDWNSVIATFTYQAQVLIDGMETPVKVEKNFVMTKIKTEPGKEAIDYYLELSQSSVNTTSKSGTIAVIAKKQEGTVISGITSNDGVEISCSSDSGWDNSAKEYEYSQGQSGEIIFTLTVNGQEWDKQTLLLAKDGSIEELPEALTKNDIYIYYRSKNDGYAANAPTLPSNSNEIAFNENNDKWTTYNLDPLATGWNYVYRAQCVETVSNNEIKYSNFRNRKLYKVYHETIDYQEYANYYTLVRGNSDGLAYDNGKLYINARGIEVRNNDNDILIQAIGIGNNRSVTIGGWKVSPQELRADNGEAVLSSGQDYSYNSLVTNQNSYLRLGLGKVIQPNSRVEEEFSTEEFAFEGKLERDKYNGNIIPSMLQAKIVYDISKRHGQFAVLASSPNITVKNTKFYALKDPVEEVKDNMGNVIIINERNGKIKLEASGIPGTQQIILTLTYQMASYDFSDEIEFWRYFTSHYTYFSLVGNISYNIVEPDYRTRLLADGSIYCSAVKLDGEVYAKKGQIGDFDIDKGRLLVNNSLSNSLLSYDYSAKSFTITGEAGTLVTDMKLQPFYEYSALGNGRVVVGNLLHRIDKSGWNNSGIALLNADADWPGLYGFSYYFEPASPSQEYDNEAVLPELLEATEFKNVDFKEKNCRWYFNGQTWSVKDTSGNQRVITFDNLFNALQTLQNRGLITLK